MPRTFLALTVVMGVLVVAIAQESEDQNIKRTVPTIVFEAPYSNNKDLYAQRCPAGVIGRISRSLGWKQNVDFQFFHVLENGDLLYQGRGSVLTDEKGEFGASYEAPRNGWPPGKLRIYARVNGFPAITGTAEMNIVDEKLQPIQGPQVGVPAPKDSGVVIDTDDPEAKKFFLPPKATFRIRGTFLPEERFRNSRPEILSIRVVRRLPDGTLDKLIVGNAGSYVFRDTEGQDDKPWFDMEMASPPFPGDFHITMETFAGEKRITLWKYDLRLRYVPDEDDDKKND